MKLDSNLYSDQQGELYTTDTQFADTQTDQNALTCPEDSLEVSCPLTNQSEAINQAQLESQPLQPQNRVNNFEYSEGEIVHEDPDSSVKPLIIAEDSDSFLEESTESEVPYQETASTINVLPQPKNIKVVVNSNQHKNLQLNLTNVFMLPLLKKTLTKI